MNHVTLIGRITRNLVLRETNNQKNYVFFTIAVNDLSNKTDYINCIAWNRVAENMTKFVGKGSLISVSGRLISRKDNKDQYIMEVLANSVSFLDNRKKDTNSEHVTDYSPSAPKNNLKSKEVNIDEAFETSNTENYDTEIKFANNESIEVNDDDSDDAIIWN